MERTDDRNNGRDSRALSGKQGESTAGCAQGSTMEPQLPAGLWADPRAFSRVTFYPFTHPFSVTSHWLRSQKDPALAGQNQPRRRGNPASLRSPASPGQTAILSYDVGLKCQLAAT